MVGGTLARRAYVGLVLETRPAAAGGLHVRDVMPGSSAERAGVAPGDRLVRMGAEAVTALPAVRAALKAAVAGDKVALEVVRDGRPLAFTLEVIAFPVEQHEGARIELGHVEAGGSLLRAVSLVPDAPGPHPVVYFLPGAHWASEEYPLDPEHPVPALLGALARAGYGSVRVERSGVGDSQGPPCGRVDFVTELAGYRAGLELVRSAAWVDHERVFLFGHSLGAMTAPLLAGVGGVAGVACYAPSAIPISDALVGAIVRHAELTSNEGAPERDRAARIGELIRLVVASGRTPQEVFVDRPDLAEIAPDHFRADSAYFRIASFYHQLERVDLVSAWQHLGAPALFIHGERDHVCTVEDARRLVALAGNGSRCVSVTADHHMSDATCGPQRLAPSVFTTLRDWLGGVG